MASVLNRVTKEYRESANTPEFSSVNWIINPNLSAVAGQPSRYWTITGDVVSLMSPAERTAADAALLVAARESVVAALTNSEDLQRAFMLLVLDELNNHAAKINAILTAIDAGANIGAVKTNIAAIADLPARTAGDLITAARNKLGT